jgi:hypothetical protein
MFEAVVEPVLLRFETDQDACRFAVTRNNDFLRLGLTEIAGQVVLDCGERNFFHAGLPNCASHKAASDFATIANTSTVVPDTS